MIAQAIDNNGDWNLGVVSNINAILQSINTRLRCLKNDCFFDLDAGLTVENFDINRQDDLIGEIYDIILNTEGVLKILSFNTIPIDDRGIKVEYAVSTIFTNTISNTIIL